MRIVVMSTRMVKKNNWIPNKELSYKEKKIKQAKIKRGACSIRIFPKEQCIANFYIVNLYEE